MNLFSEVESAINSIGDGWTTVDKGQIIASMIVALRPSLSLEIGVYYGKGLVSMALAHKAIGVGMAVGIDPYDAKSSLEGQVNEADRIFWSENVNYEAAYNSATHTLARFGCHECSRILRQRSDQVQAPSGIGVLRIDGNHGDMAVRDAMKFCPHVQRGGFVFIDDVDWAGKAPTRAAQWLESQPQNWKKLYALDDGLVFQRL